MLIFLSFDGSGTLELAKRADKVLSATGKPLIGELKKKESGAPYCENYRVSVAHTDDVAVLALASSPVGIDVERSDREVPAPMKDIINWTAYEAKCKLRGDGTRLSEVREGGAFSDGVTFHTFLKGYTIAVAGGDASVFVSCG